MQNLKKIDRAMAELFMFEEGQIKNKINTKTKKIKLAMQQQTKQPQVRIGLIWLGIKLGLGYSLTDIKEIDLQNEIFC